MDTSHEGKSTHPLHEMLGRWLRPGVGFNRPCDVLKDEDLSWSEKRSVLASWASDASAVADHPYLRWMIGTPAPVPLGEVQDALDRLSWCEAWLQPQSAHATH
jgi:hypothetical protein